MNIRRFLIRLFVCITCVFCMPALSFAEETPSQTITEQATNWMMAENMSKFNSDMEKDLNKLQNNFETHVNSAGFVPIEVRIGLMFMRALSSIDYVLQISLVRFTIIFLLVMYAFWIGLEAYKMIRESTEYKTVVYDIFKKGMIIAVWIMVLQYGPVKIFSLVINPVIALGTYLSNFILDTVAQTYNIDIPDTCQTIHSYVNANNSGKILVDAETAANIMCLPGRISMYFYHATVAGFKWMIWGFGHSITAIVVGAVSVVIFIKCILKYAFMTLGVVADLFFTLLMLPFTALAEAIPKSEEKNYAGQIFNVFLKVFNTKKLSDVISTFINAAIYFVSLAIIIGICATLLSQITNVSGNKYFVGSAMTTILAGCLILYLAGQADKLAEQVGGKIDNVFGKQIETDAKNIWSSIQKFGKSAIKGFVKK